MNKSATALFPNARYIDWVLGSVRSNPEVWIEASFTAWNGLNDLRHRARIAAWEKLNRSKRSGLRAVRVFQAAGLNGRLVGAPEAALALMTYDDCEWQLNMSYEQLRLYTILGGKPQAVLLLPMKWVQENEALVASR